jgi:hypothetical protein
MTKWFDTNYHYLVPEIEEPFLAGKFAAEVDFTDFLQQIAKSRDIVAAAAAGKTVPALPSRCAASRHKRRPNIHTRVGCG